MARVWGCGISFIYSAPAKVAAAANDLAGIGTEISEANDSASAPTTAALAAGADQVSAAVSAVFTTYAEHYQWFGAQMAAFHEQFVAALLGTASSYAGAEASNIRALLGHP